METPDTANTSYAKLIRQAEEDMKAVLRPFAGRDWSEVLEAGVDFKLSVIQKQVAFELNELGVKRADVKVLPLLSLEAGRLILLKDLLRVGVFHQDDLKQIPSWWRLVV